jgi:hypothetical protein
VPIFPTDGAALIRQGTIRHDRTDRHYIFRRAVVRSSEPAPAWLLAEKLLVWRGPAR